MFGWGIIKIIPKANNRLGTQIMTYTPERDLPYINNVSFNEKASDNSGHVAQFVRMLSKYTKFAG